MADEHESMTYFLYILTMLLSSGQSVFARFYNQKGGSSSVFNAVKAFSGFALFLSWTLIEGDIHGITLLYGLLYGVFLTAAMQAGYLAIMWGPLSLSSLISSFSMLLPLLYGIAFSDERLGVLGLIGLALLLLTVLLLKKKETNAPPITKAWWIAILTTFLMNGLCSIVQKIHQEQFPGLYTSEFMVGAMLVPLIFFSVHSLTKREQGAPLKTSGFPYAALAGISMCGANFITLTLAGSENASVLFPIVSVGTMLCSLLFAKILFKESIGKRRLLAFFIGVIAVLLLKLG